MPFRIWWKSRIQNYFSTGFAANAVDDFSEVFGKRFDRNTIVFDIVVIHPKTNENEVRMLIEDFILQPVQALPGRISACGSIDRLNFCVWIPLLQPVNPALPKNKFT